MRLHTAMMIAGVVAVGWLALGPSTAAPQAQVPDHLDEREELLTNEAPSSAQMRVARRM